MVSWNNPSTTSNYLTEVLQDLKARDASSATMFHGTSDTNIPTEAKRFDTSVGYLERYTGAAWAALSFGWSGTMTGFGTAIIRATGEASLVQYAGGGSNSAQLHLYGDSHASFPGRIDFVSGNTSGSFNFNARGASATYNFATAGTTRWTLANAGHWNVGAGNAYDIGAAAATVRDVYARRLLAGTSNALMLNSSGTDAWQIDVSQHLVAQGSFQIKTNAATTVLSIYGGSTNSGASLDFYGTSHATFPGRIDIYTGTGAGGLNFAARHSSGQIVFALGGTTRWYFDSSANGSHLLPNAELTYSLGGATTRIHTFYGGTVRLRTTSANYTTAYSERYTAAGETVNTANTDLITVALADNTTYSVRVHSVSRLVSTTAKGRSQFIIVGAYRNNGGGATLIATGADVGIDATYGGITGNDPLVTVLVSSNNLIVRAGGGIGTPGTYEHFVSVEIIRVSTTT